MLGVVPDFEHDTNLRIKGLNIEPIEIGFSVEHQTVDSGSEGLIYQKEWLDATIFIGPCVAQFSPTLICVLSFKADRDSVGR